MTRVNGPIVSLEEHGVWPTMRHSNYDDKEESKMCNVFGRVEARPTRIYQSSCKSSIQECTIVLHDGQFSNNTQLVRKEGHEKDPLNNA